MERTGTTRQTNKAANRPQTSGAPQAVRSPQERLLNLQQSIGNQAIGRLLRSCVAPACRSGDASEREDTQRELEKLQTRVFTCPPAPDTIANAAGMAGPGTLGWAKIDKSSQLLCAPRFVLDAKSGTGTLKTVTTTLSITSKYVQEQPPAPSGESMQLPECGGKQVPIYSAVTKDISALAKQGEQEHCDDLNLAYKNTLEPCAAAVNKFAGQKFPGKTEGECYKALTAKLGFDPMDCTSEFIAISKKTDERDANGWHDFDPVLISKGCDKIVVGNKKSAKNKIGDASVAPGKFIPAARKCGGAAASAPATPPPVAPPSPSPKSEGAAKDAQD